MNKIYLKNEIPAILKENKSTPRISVCIYLKITEAEKRAGEYSLLNRLFLQGTKNRTSEKLAQELDENAIECYSEMKCDFIRFKLLCLNEDLEKGLDILSDIIQNSTLDEFEKEKIKLSGEITAELDSPKSKAMDAFYKNFYENHPYGNTYTRVLEELDNIDKDEIKTLYTNLLENSPKIISVAGDFEGINIEELLEKYFSSLKNSTNTNQNMPVPELKEKKVIKIEKEDASQAQIIQGWMFPTINSEEYPAILLLNTILGASGLSSRLFVELRDKKGLAYVVRSMYETFNKSACFSVYIATEPKNIKTSLQGFKIELDKIKNEIMQEEELENAKNNLIGKRDFFTETNLQQASLMGYHEDKGLGYNFEKELIERIKKVTVKEIQEIADKYIKEPSVLTVLAPKKYLEIE